MKDEVQSGTICRRGSVIDHPMAVLIGPSVGRVHPEHISLSLSLSRPFYFPFLLVILGCTFFCASSDPTGRLSCCCCCYCCCFVFFRCCRFAAARQASIVPSRRHVPAFSGRDGCAIHALTPLDREKRTKKPNETQ